MNKITISGRLVADPELRATADGTEVCNFTLAVDRRVPDRNGDKRTDFPDFVAWGKTAVFICKYFHKGDGINVVGRLESRKWVDKDGHNRTSWEIICEEVEFTLSKPNGATRAEQAGGYGSGQSTSGDTGGFTDVTASENDLPDF